MGEIIQAHAISLPLLLLVCSEDDGDCEYNYKQICLALTYPVYYIVLFIPRQMMMMLVQKSMVKYGLNILTKSSIELSPLY